jgi:hypothetical protein
MGLAGATPRAQMQGLLHAARGAADRWMRGRRTADRRIAAVVAIAVLAEVLTLMRPLGAQEQLMPRISVAPAILAQAGSQMVLPIRITLLEAAPQKAFISLRGLPPGMALTEGQSVGPGSWAIPLARLPALKVRIPAGFSGRAEIVISLIALDGRLLSQATTTLIARPPDPAGEPDRGAPDLPARPGTTAPVAPPREVPVERPEPAGKPEPTTPVPPRTTGLADAERARAERLLAQGEAYQANGNIIGARDFFERAADAGLAAAALRLAGTYDPAELKRLEVQGVAPDVAMARKWYQRARDLGAPEAPDLLDRLEGH